jgi:hypothetical protein
MPKAAGWEVMLPEDRRLTVRRTRSLDGCGGDFGPLAFTPTNHMSGEWRYRLTHIPLWVAEDSIHCNMDGGRGARVEEQTA